MHLSVVLVFVLWFLLLCRDLYVLCFCLHFLFALVMFLFCLLFRYLFAALFAYVIVCFCLSSFHISSNLSAHNHPFMQPAVVS